MTEYQIADCQKALEEFAQATDDNAIYLRLKKEKPRDSQWRYRRLVIEIAEEIERILHPLTWSQRQQPSTQSHIP